MKMIIDKKEVEISSVGGIHGSVNFSITIPAVKNPDGTIAVHTQSMALYLSRVEALSLAVALKESTINK